MLSPFQFPPHTQYLGYSPCLSDAPIGEMWRVTCQDFRNGAKSRIAQMVLEQLQQHECGIQVTMYTIVCLDISTHQPGPHGPLVVCTISPGLIASVVTVVGRMVWTQGT